MWVPACMDEVLGVGATYDSVGGTRTTPDEVASFTNTSDSLDLLAPGVSITSSARGGGTTTLSGTSMAAPHVAGLIALMIQAGGRAFPADRIVSILKNTGKPVLDARNGLTSPRIDALTAIASTPRAPEKPRRRATRH
jgi:serine protease